MHLKSNYFEFAHKTLPEASRHHITTFGFPTMNSAAGQCRVRVTCRHIYVIPIEIPPFNQIIESISEMCPLQISWLPAR